LPEDVTLDLHRDLRLLHLVVAPMPDGMENFALLLGVRQRLCTHLLPFVVEHVTHRRAYYRSAQFREEIDVPCPSKRLDIAQEAEADKFWMQRNATLGFLVFQVADCAVFETKAWNILEQLDPRQE
jgi:hypothetical protein